MSEFRLGNICYGDHDRSQLFVVSSLSSSEFLKWNGSDEQYLTDVEKGYMWYGNPIGVEITHDILINLNFTKEEYRYSIKILYS